jgi:cystathionine beta-lyase/cystathionine gamma-synthase
MRPQTKLVYVETPANPILRLTDIAACAEIAHAGGALLAVDSTFATPLATRPIELGADFVLHALTKYFCGHGDALGGCVAGRTRAMLDLRTDSGVHLGASLSPFNAWLINRGVDTLPLRMREHERNASALAQFLEGHPGVARVFYPGLPSHPQHALAKRQMANFSGMLSFQPKADGVKVAQRMARDLKVFHYAVSLGHQRSLIVYLNTGEVNRQSFQLAGDALARYQAFAGDGIFRVSVGLEDADDLIADLDAVLK